MQDVLHFMGLSFLTSFVFFLMEMPAVQHRGLGAKAALHKLLLVLITGCEPYLMALLTVSRIRFIRRLRRHCIFVSDSSCVAKAATVDVMVFDKTGTLTVDQVTHQPRSLLHASKGLVCLKQASTMHVDKTDAVLSALCVQILKYLSCG